MVFQLTFVVVCRESCIYGDYFGLWQSDGVKLQNEVARFRTKEEAEAFLSDERLCVGYREVDERIVGIFQEDLPLP